MPKAIGSNTAMKAMTGNFEPSMPKAIKVKNGPSFRERTATAATSERLPYCPVKAAYMPPLPLVMAAMMAIADRPRKPFIMSPDKYPPKNPTATPVKYAQALAQAIQGNTLPQSVNNALTGLLRDMVYLLADFVKEPYLTAR